MGNYIRTGNTVSVAAEGSMSVFKELPAAVYTINMAPMQPITLSIVEDLSIPNKLYGDINSITERVINTFRDRTGNTGILLEGLKGSGKTLLAKNISVNLLEQGVPTIIVAYNQICPMMVDFINTIDTECVVLFDEIDKCQDNENNDYTNCMLSMLDGLSVRKKLFILTANEYSRINNYFKHRPGRIYYRLKFEGLDSKFIEDYATDSLLNKDNLKSLLIYCGNIRDLSFDVLSSIVEEMNRYNATAREALKYLNVDISFRRTCERVVKDKNGNVVPDKYQPEIVDVDLLYGTKWSIWLLDDEGEEMDTLTVLLNQPVKITSDMLIYNVVSEHGTEYTVEFTTKKVTTINKEDIMNLLV